jgi:hypothetical protein
MCGANTGAGSIRYGGVIISRDDAADATSMGGDGGLSVTYTIKYDDGVATNAPLAHGAPHGPQL